MKIRNIFTVAICSALLVGAGSALFAYESAKSQKSVKINATTDVGEIAIDQVRNAISTDSVLYLLPTAENSLPDSWDFAYTAVGETDGVFINGAKYDGAVIKHAGTGSAFVTFYFGLPSAAVEGDVVEFKGQFASEAAGYSFSIHYSAQRFSSTWIHALEDYDVVSLEDANLPNFSDVAINTDDMGLDTSYVTDPAGLPKKYGYFGLTNNTGSYAFQFNYQKSDTGTGWFHVLIGGQGPLFRTGHFMDFGFLDAWATTGHTVIREMQGYGENWDATELQATGAIALGWNVGGTNLLEMGSVKVKGSTKNYIFFKVNGELKFGDYWQLADGGMTTKVTLQYAGTDATVSNSINVTATQKLHTSDGTTTGLYTYSNICPGVENWDDYFKSVDGDGLQLNGVSFGDSAWNYFKKTGSANYYLDLAGAGAGELHAGDILYIGGIFKAARNVNGVLTLFKVVFQDSYFQYDGTAWREVDTAYTAVDFSKDLLKMTLSICDGVNFDNADDLETAWIILGGKNYYGKLVQDQRDILGNVVADDTIVVPTTSENIDLMSDDDALAAAMARYEYCTEKYSLTAFINGRVLSSNYTSMNPVKVNNNVLLIVIVAATITLCSLACVTLYIRRRKHSK